ncbi:MAG: type II toxin-antitoxin system PemK/MazF family toxin [Chloroflexi bacterium]|nr:type II toxin-antitoxin system PemK/MazF family toxin [Chloroflexota bacterium]
MKRGDVYLARLDPSEGSEQAGVRPVVIVSRDSLNETISTLIVVPCTTLREGKSVYPQQVVARAPEGGLPQDSIVLCEQVRTIGKHRLLRLLGSLSPGTMSRVERGLTVALQLNRPPLA